MKKNIIYLIAILLMTSFISCDNDDVDKNNSVFDEDILPAKNEFDNWLENNFRVPYNTQVVYQFDFMDTDFSYNLTPPKFDIATQFSQIVKYCWYECYDEVAGMHFTRKTIPKQIYLIGSQGLDPQTNSETLATAAGGLRVVIYRLNLVKSFDNATITKYMHIMNHEFSHILDQQIKIDPEFGAISEKNYIGDYWTEAKTILGNWYQAGFVSDYASSEPDEDFAEVYSLYISKSPAEWEQLLKEATKFNSVTGEVIDRSGRDAIEKKLAMIKDYLMEEWNIDMEVLRESAQRRARKAEDLEYISFNEFTN